MAVLIARQSGNFEAAGTWALPATDALQLSYGSFATLLTSYIWSDLFTVSGVTIDSVLIQYGNLGQPTDGNLIVCLSSDGGTTYSQIVTLPATGLYSERSNLLCYFPQARSYNSSQMALGLRTTVSDLGIARCRAGSASDWFRVLRTTAVGGSPASSDWIFISGPLESGGTANLLTITYNSNRTTQTVGTVELGMNGYLYLASVTNQTVQFLYDMATEIWAGGHLWIGSSLADGQLGSFSTTSTAIYKCHRNLGAFRVRAYGELKAFSGFGPGPARAFLACPLPTGGSVLTLDTTVRWRAGQEILLAASTGLTHTKATLAADVNDSSIVTLTAPVTIAYGGGTWFSTPVLNLTRNVWFQNRTLTSTSYRSIMEFYDKCQVHVDGVGYYNLGGYDGRGIRLWLGSSGAVTVERCVFQNCYRDGIIALAQGAASAIAGEPEATIVFRHNNFYDCYSGIWATLATTTYLIGQVDLSSNSLVRSIMQSGGQLANLITDQLVNLRGLVSYGLGIGLQYQGSLGTTDQASNWNNFQIWHGSETLPAVQFSGNVLQGQVFVGWQVGNPASGQESVAVQDSYGQVGVTQRDSVLYGRYGFELAKASSWIFGGCQFGYGGAGYAGILDRGKGGLLVLEDCIATGLGTYPLIHCPSLDGACSLSRIWARNLWLSGSLSTAGPFLPGSEYHLWMENGLSTVHRVWPWDTLERSASSLVTRSAPFSERILFRADRAGYSAVRSVPYSIINAVVTAWLYQSDITGEAFQMGTVMLVVLPDPANGLDSEWVLASISTSNGNWYALSGTLRTDSTMASQRWVPDSPTMARLAIKVLPATGAGALYLDDWQVRYLL